MEFAVIILATLSVILLLQIIILVNQQKNGKMVRELMAQRAKPFQSDRERFHDRKENNFRQNRQHQQDLRSKQPQGPSASAPAGNVDNVEKSLRDINLKLKNAERDQEVARRRIQDNIGNRDHSRRRHHNDNNRGGRDDGRDHRRDRHSRNNWRNRNNEEKPYQESDRPGKQPDDPAPTTAPVITEMSAVSSAPSLPDLNPSDFDTDTTEHGRKFMVKRRLLKEELPGESPPDHSEGGPAEPFTTSLPVADSTATAPSDTSGQPEQTNDNEISFGRR
ncbi:MAG: hypothetical protein JW913_18130 [Chitinispirillaceae bacterium]|nr:hypothetical protein [Chitinispirillaceae bacterium]